MAKRATQSIDSGLAEQTSLPALLGDTLQQVIDLLQADAGAIFVADEQARELLLTGQQGLSPTFVAREACLPFGTCMCGHTVEADGALFLVDDVTRHPLCVNGSCFEDGFRSLLCLPLRASGQVWGLLRLHGRRRAAFDQREEKLLRFVASQLGQAIQRARLHEKASRVAEAERRRSEELSALNELKSQLLATVSHELRTPLASIKGFVTTLLRDDVQWDAATQREFLHIIDQESDRLAELIGNLLEMSRLEAGVLRMDRDWVAIPPLVEEALGGLRARAAGRTLTLDMAEDLPQVYADGRRIRQVLHNLLENALKYSTDGEIRVRARAEGAEVILSVSDQGPGLAPGHLERIFERFYRVEGASARHAGGAGLGLSISKGLVEAHSGRIWAESTPGLGSTFYFSLPIQEK